MKQNKSLDSYGTHAPKIEWFQQYIKSNGITKFSVNNSLGNNEIPKFKRFLRDTYILDEDGNETNLCKMLLSKGIENDDTWALMLLNLCYTPQINWFVNNFEINKKYTQKYISGVLDNTEGVSVRAVKSIPTDLKRIFNLPLGKLGLGIIEPSINKEEGYTVHRIPWATPSSLVILYSLYRYAEGCGGYYQFSLSRLYDEGVSCDGVSPVRIFGTEKERMKQILNGLSVNHSDFISASFTLDLDNINLNQEKTHNDVLALF